MSDDPEDGLLAQIANASVLRGTRSSCRPSGAGACGLRFQGLTPLATLCRRSAAKTSHNLGLGGASAPAPEGRHDVARGVSPWKVAPPSEAPEGRHELRPDDVTAPVSTAR